MLDLHRLSMLNSYGSHVKVMRLMHSSSTYHQDMDVVNMDPTSTRTLTIVLPEADWRALRAAEPDAIGWLQARIRERLSASGAPEPRNGRPAATAESWWGEDEY
jgi:hypothetical protein